MDRRGRFAFNIQPVLVARLRNEDKHQKRVKRSVSLFDFSEDTEEQHRERLSDAISKAAKKGKKKGRKRTA